MTEAEWLACHDPFRMTKLLGEIETERLQRLAAALGRDVTGQEYWDRAAERKWRLLAAACCRRIWFALVDPRLRHAVEVAEPYADSEADDETLRAAHDAAAVVFAAERRAG